MLQEVDRLLSFLSEDPAAIEQQQHHLHLSRLFIRLRRAAALLHVAVNSSSPSLFSQAYSQCRHITEDIISDGNADRSEQSKVVMRANALRQTMESQASSILAEMHQKSSLQEPSNATSNRGYKNEQLRFQSLFDDASILHNLTTSSNLPSSLSLTSLARAGLSTADSSSSYTSLNANLRDIDLISFRLSSSPLDSSQQWLEILHELKNAAESLLASSRPLKSLGSPVNRNTTDRLKTLLAPWFTSPSPPFSIPDARQQLLSALDCLEAFAKKSRSDQLTALRTRLSFPKLSYDDIAKIAVSTLELCHVVQSESVPVHFSTLQHKLRQFGLSEFDDVPLIEEKLRLIFRNEAQELERDAVTFGWRSDADSLKTDSEEWLSDKAPSDALLSPRARAQSALVATLMTPSSVAVYVPIMNPTENHNSNHINNKLPPCLILQASVLFTLQNKIQAVCIISCLSELYPTTPSHTIERILALLDMTIQDDKTSDDGIKLDNIADELIKSGATSSSSSEVANIHKTVKRVLSADDPVFKLILSRLKGGMNQYLSATRQESTDESGGERRRRVALDKMVTSHPTRSNNNIQQLQRSATPSLLKSNEPTEKDFEHAHNIKGFTRHQVLVKTVAEILKILAEVELWCWETWNEVFELLNNTTMTTTTSDTPPSSAASTETGSKRKASG